MTAGPTTSKIWTGTPERAHPSALRRLRDARRSAFATGFRAPPKLTVSEWADERRRLSAEASAEPGNWYTSRAEYQRGIMDAFSEPGVHTVVVMSSSQVGKTEIENNVIGYHMDQDPAPILLMLPTLEMAQAWSKDRLAPMLRDTPALHGLVKDPKGRDSGNTLLHKTFAGGHITMCGANSPASLAMRPIRVVLCDEADRYPRSAGTEGDPITLVFARSQTFWNRRHGIFSTPTLKGASRIESAFEESDQRHFWVPCPDCGEPQKLRWGGKDTDYGVKWDRDEEGQPLPETAHYLCKHCDIRWDDNQRWQQIAKGAWVAEAEWNGVAGFHLNAIYSPWVRLVELVKEWLAAQGNPERLKTFTNTKLGETFEVKGSTVAVDDLRRESFEERDGVLLSPEGVLVHVSSIDVQDDRLEWGLWGFGIEEEAWALDHVVIEGDPSAKAVWKEAWGLICKPRPLAVGGSDYIRATCIDTGGHHTQPAYDFCRPRTRVQTPDGRLAYTWAIKGLAGAGQVWPREASRNNIGKIPLWRIRIDAAKAQLYGRLQKVVEAGPGYIHIPNTEKFGERWGRQLTAEKMVPKTNRQGFTAYEWKKKSDGRRNEALDLWVYAYAALCGLKMHGFDLDDEARRQAIIRARAEKERAEERPKATPDPAQAKARQAVRKKAKRRAKSGYMKGRRGRLH